MASTHKLIHKRFFIAGIVLLVVAILLSIYLGGYSKNTEPSSSNSDSEQGNILTPEVPSSNISIPPAVKNFAEKSLPRTPYHYSLYDKRIDATNQEVVVCDTGLICSSKSAKARAYNVLSTFNITHGYSIESITALHIPSTNMYDWGFLININNTTWHLVINSYTGSVTYIDIPLKSETARRLTMNMSWLLQVLLGNNYTEIYGEIELRNITEEKILMYQKYNGLYVFNNRIPPGINQPCSGYIELKHNTFIFVFTGYPIGLTTIHEPSLSPSEVKAGKIIENFVYNKINTSDIEIEIASAKYIGKEIYVYDINNSYIVYVYQVQIAIKTNTNIYITMKVALYDDTILDYMVKKPW